VDGENFHGIVSPKKMVVSQFDGSVFVCFHEENSGVRKFNSKGEFLMKLGNVQLILDMTLDSVHDKLYLIASYQTSPTTRTCMLQAYNGTTGQVVHCVDLGGSFTKISLGGNKNELLFLVDEGLNQLKSFHMIKEQLFKQLKGTSFCGIRASEIRAITTAPNGTIFILSVVGNKSVVVMGYSPNSESFNVVPIQSSTLIDPTAMCADRKLIYFADPARNRVVSVFHSGRSVALAESEEASKDGLLWEPNTLSFGPRGQIFVGDKGSTNIVKIPPLLLKK
jgi:hypothetical protein